MDPIDFLARVALEVAKVLTARAVAWIIDKWPRTK
jgi:hypothetical protein